MLASELRGLLLTHRDNDVVSGRGQKKILSTHYDTTSDQIVLELEDDDVAWSEDVANHIATLDRWLSRIDFGHRVAYVEWLTQMAELLGGDVAELMRKRHS